MASVLLVPPTQDVILDGIPKEEPVEIIETLPERVEEVVMLEEEYVPPPAPKPVQAAPVSGSCHDWMRAAGVNDMETAYLLIMKESGCNPRIWNGGGSGACGIPQSLPCSKLPQGINTPPVDQIVWMQNYVNARYGSWDAAWAHSEAKNWY